MASPQVANANDILVIEDDPRVARLVQRALVEDGYRVELAYDGHEGEAKANQLAPEVIVLDVMLPGQDGIAVCRHLRDRGVRTPVLMLTARDAIPDRVRGLDAGADDYLTKPFALDELLARIRALLRRPGSLEGGAEVLQVGDLKLNLDSHEATRADQPIELTTKEYRLLAYLMRHAGRILTRGQIVDQVWGYDTSVKSNIVEIYICYLRDKIDRGFPRPLIRTVRGAGYMLKS
ncbi:MAG TPA: response regulator transcription factor [Chloroflexota bacterium]|nr:response regulator transcription factor [Chloroflexota bacterium]